MYIVKVGKFGFKTNTKFFMQHIYKQIIRSSLKKKKYFFHLGKKCCAFLSILKIKLEMEICTSFPSKSFVHDVERD